MKPAFPLEVFDIDGNIIRIEFHNPDGIHIIDALWDPNDEQTVKNRQEFRKWAYRQLKQQGYEVQL
jgi:hypothetical protein